MKPVFKCDYCDFVGTENEVTNHEPNCRENYNMKSCYTCKHNEKAEFVEGGIKYICDKGKDIPVNNIYEFCDEYEKKEKKEFPFAELFKKSIFSNW